MPIAMHPNKKFRIVLECDKNMDPAPCFVYPYLTGAQQESLVETYNRIDDTSDQTSNFNRTFEAAGRHLLGWENLTDADGNAIPFAADRLKEVVSVMEAIELINKLFNQQSLTLDDKKK